MIGKSRIKHELAFHLWPEGPDLPKPPSSPLPKRNPDGPDIESPMTMRVLLFDDGSWSCSGTVAGEVTPIVTMGGDGSEPEAQFFRDIVDTVLRAQQDEAKENEGQDE